MNQNPDLKNPDPNKSFTKTGSGTDKKQQRIRNPAPEPKKFNRDSDLNKRMSSFLKTGSDQKTATNPQPWSIYPNPKKLN